MGGISLFHCAFDEDTLDSAQSLLRGVQLASGAHVAALEREFEAYLGAGSAVAMGDMTHALTLALQLAGVAAGDEVLTLSYNCLSSNSAIAAIGATPVWVDIVPETASFCLDAAAAAISPRTKALVVYHVAGYPADLFALRKFCDSHQLPLIEDANNALGATFNGANAGTVGDFAVFSFYANRQVNAIEGAILISKNANHAIEARKLRRFGIDVSNFRNSDGEINPASDIPVIGMSSPLTNFNAILARHGLHSLNDRINRNRENVRKLTAAVDGLPGLRAVKAVAGAGPCYWAWLVHADHRGKLMRDLKSAGIACSKLHYPNHEYTGFKGSARRLDGTKLLMETILAIPCGWWLDDEAIAKIATVVRESTLCA